MHSSRMRTARSSSHLLGAGVFASAHAGIPPGPGPRHPLSPWVWAWRPPLARPPNPPGRGPLDPSPARPPTSPLGVGLETPPSQTPQPPGCGPGDPQPDPPTSSPQMWVWRPPPPADRETLVKT